MLSGLTGGDGCLGRSYTHPVLLEWSGRGSIFQLRPGSLSSPSPVKVWGLLGHPTGPWISAQRARNLSYNHLDSIECYSLERQPGASECCVLGPHRPRTSSSSFFFPA